MNCPKCQCDEISDSGTCLWCGYQVIAPAAGLKPGLKEEQDYSGKVEAEYSHPPPASAREDLLQWRQELAQHPPSIEPKQNAAGEQAQAESKILPGADSETPAPERLSQPSAQPDLMAHPHPQPPETRRQLDQSHDRLPAASALPQESKSPFESKQFAADFGLRLTDPQDSRGYIDRMTSRQSRQPETSARVAEVLFRSPSTSSREEGRKILLSRTLSGLVDLTIMALSTGALIMAADFFSGIRVLDFTSIINYLVLSLLVYFTYSLFFLGITGQTIGMMIVNLQVVAGTGDMRLQMRRILARCFCYLPSLLFMGIGLLWALFDQECRCLHDILTNTRVVRTNSSASRMGY